MHLYSDAEACGQAIGSAEVQLRVSREAQRLRYVVVHSIAIAQAIVQREVAERTTLEVIVPIGKELLAGYPAHRRTIMQVQ